MKEISELYEGMLETFEEKTGFAMEDTTDLAVRLYAAAAEIQALYIYADWALTQSFPQSAAGKYLDYHGQLRGITRKSGHKAGGILRFKIDSARAEPLRVPAGTVCTTAGLVRFVTTEDALIRAGALYADAAAEAEIVGTAGNVPAERITNMTRAPVGVTGVTNPAAFAGGSGEEDDESLRERILDSFIRLPNGANAAFYELRALSHPGVEAVRVIPRHQGIGTVGVVVSTAGGVPEQALLQEIQDDLDSVREIAVDVTVMAPELERMDLAVRILPKPGKSFDSAQAAVRTALTAWFDGGLLGKPVYRTQLGKVILDTGVVETYAITAPTKDLPGNARRLPQLGTLTITEGV